VKDRGRSKWKLYEFDLWQLHHKTNGTARNDDGERIKDLWVIKRIKIMYREDYFREIKWGERQAVIKKIILKSYWSRVVFSWNRDFSLQILQIYMTFLGKSRQQKWYSYKKGEFIQTLPSSNWLQARKMKREREESISLKNKNQWSQFVFVEPSRLPISSYISYIPPLIHTHDWKIYHEVISTLLSLHCDQIIHIHTTHSCVCVETKTDMGK